jgi:nicotinamide-nucleotide amidase
MTNSDSSAALVTRIAEKLKAENARVSTAESCTGGWLAKTLTDLPGSSDWFEYGFVSYGNNAKQDLLAVPAETLDRYGAVSAEAVAAMADGALSRSGAELAVAVTGIAGPDGGSADKPVGTVWFAWARRGHDPISRCRRFDGDRDAVRRQAVVAALSGLLELLDRDASG